MPMPAMTSPSNRLGPTASTCRAFWVDQAAEGRRPGGNPVEERRRGDARRDRIARRRHAGDFRLADQHRRDRQRRPVLHLPRHRPAAGGASGQGRVDRRNPPPPALDFPGEAAVESRLGDGPSMDLNVMTRRGRFTSRLIRQSAAQPKLKTPTTLIIALNSLTIISGNRVIGMLPLDALLIEGSASLTIGPKGADYYLIEISPSRP